MMWFLDLVVMGCVERKGLGIETVGKGDAGVGISGEEGKVRSGIAGVGDGSGWVVGFKCGSGLDIVVRAWNRLKVLAGLVVADRVGGVLLLTPA